MTTGAAFPAAAPSPAPATSGFNRHGPGVYPLTDVRQYAVTNLGADGDVEVDGVALPAKFTVESALLDAGETFATVTVTVTAGEALISTTA